MMIMVRCTGFLLLLTCLAAIVSSCFVEFKGEYTFSTTSNEMCECFSNNFNDDLDESLTNCLEDFQAFVNSVSEKHENSEEIVELAESGASTITSQLTKTCPKFREAYQSMIYTQFAWIERDSAMAITRRVDTTLSVKVDTFKLVAAYITQEDTRMANHIIENYQLNHPESDFAYLIKGILLHTEGETEGAIMAIDSAMVRSSEIQVKEVLGLYKNCISPLDNRNMDITVSLSNTW